MTEKSEKDKTIDRLEIVAAFLSRDYEPEMFANLFNAGDIFSYISKDTGPINASDLDRWVKICMEVAK